MEKLLQGYKILIVEDDPLLLETGYGLELFGATVFRAPNGMAAMEWLSKPDHRVDVILSDVRMPTGDGVWLLDALKKLGEIPPFFFVTGYADIGADEAIAKGAREMVSKPIGPKILAHKVASCIRPALHPHS